MSKFTIVLLLIALVTMTLARPQDDGTKVDIVDGDRQVDFVDSDPQQVHIVDPVDLVNPRNGGSK
ncbi:hypothetical protein HW555_000179 [Spodoptera exigua]|uniref:Secreted protein n=1 Tax=Spodoptera exigua TaxID=7107 RepID=A0A835GVD1_SPOEX|nr:hypothetical protein HW555_000179 [Spodoptera exigua]